MSIHGLGASTPLTGMDADLDAPTRTAGESGIGGGSAPAVTRGGGQGGRMDVGALLASLATLPADDGGPTAFELIPGRYPDCVSLPDLLEQMKGTPQARALVEALAAKVEGATGTKVPPDLIDAALADPARVTDLLAITPGQLSGGIDAMNAAHRSGAKRIEVPPKPKNLPDGFDLAKLGALDLPRPEPKLTPLVPGVLQGDIKSDLPDAQAKANRATAEIFDRLAANATLPAGERFDVAYQGKRYQRLDSFLDALRKDGHTVEVEFQHRVANFADLKTPLPDGRIADVPAALNIRTGVKDAEGREAIVPAVHSEMVIRVKPGPDTKGPGLDASVKYYQGLSGTGFFPAGLSREPDWLGKKVVGRLDGAKAVEAAALAGAMSDIVNTSASALGLAMGGYGMTGVCNDSVAIVQHATTGQVTGYPLLMRDDLLSGEIAKRLADSSRTGDALYKKLGQSIDAVPSDHEPNATAAARALASIPWEDGKEPFQAVIDAKAILGQR